MSQRRKSPPKKSRKAKKKVIRTDATKNHYLIMVALAIICILAFLPLFQSTFLNYDDDIYITANPFIVNPSINSFKTLFCSFYLQQYAPLAMSIMSLEIMLFGLNIVPLKLVSLLLHFLNASLVFILIKSLFKRFDVAVITAACFAIHPLQVEATAWLAASMKINSYAFFFLGSLICYIKYLKQKQQKYFIYTLLLFTCSALCKEQAIILPFLLPLIDYVKDRKLLEKSVAVEKLPFVGIASLLMYLTILNAGAQQNTILITSYSIAERLLLSLIAFGRYLYNFLLPVNLSTYYTYPPEGILSIESYFYISITIGFLVAIYFAFRKKEKILIFALGFFCINLFLPVVSTILSVREVFMADRYMYVPIIGLGLILGYAYNRISSNYKNRKKWYVAFLLAVGLLLSARTYARVQVWKNSITVFKDAIEQGSKNSQSNRYLATPYNNRGLAYRNANDAVAAMNDYNRAIELDPDHAKARLNRGNLYFASGQFQMAATDFDKAIEIDPLEPKGYSSRAALYATQQKFELALNEIAQALKLDPYQKEALQNRIKIYDTLGQKDKALAEIDAYLKVYPSDQNIMALRNSLMTRE